jgi:hypothetical protein
VVGFSEEEDVQLMSGGEVVDVHGGGMDAAGAEVDEVKWLGCVMWED